ncbi:MAG TPA: NAD(P)/FAD-dependent oxidoreductase [Actinomycetota bacterium]|nr:NAD(P)/FAD-dependent oxidoreductase [Actinomycetota bacterium]
MSERADVVVIGMGPGGEDLAGKLAEKGMSVIGIDHGLVGGECPYWGCIPSKMMIRAANLLAEARRVDGMAGTATVTPDWSVVATRIREEATDNWDDRVAVERFEKKGGRFIRGTARFAGAGKVEVDGTTIEAPRIVVNAGTVPLIPPIPGLSDVHYWTNHHAIETKELPATLTILGGGPIGLELGQMFGRFGVKVTIVEAGERILSPEEPESSALLAEVFEREGIVVRTNAAAEKVSMEGGDIALSLSDGSTVRGEKLLVAVGRRAPIKELNVSAIGIDENARFLPVDERGRVTDGVWAIGDITGKGNFTHMSMYEANIAMHDILGDEGPVASYHAVPHVTFTDPEIGSVGMSEKAARDAGINVRVGNYPVPRSTRGWIHKAGNDGYIKLIEDRARGVLVGATSAGPAGGEVLSVLTLAVHAAIPVEQLRSMIFAYPTFHRSIEAALDELLSH